MNNTDIFLDNVWKFSNREFPNYIIEQVKYTLIDYMGATLAGAKVTEEEFKEFFKEEGGSFRAVGVEQPVSFLQAAFMNGYNSHVLEMDDGHRLAMLHLSTTIFSAMLVVAQKEKLDFKKFVKGVVVGFEVSARLAMVIQPSHKQKGYHATATCGVCGVAMAVAAALDFTREEMKNAFSAAITSASGLLEMIVGKSQMKPYNSAISVQNGITAAYFGKLNFCGPDDALGGARGFLNVLSDAYELSRLKINKGDKYCIEQVYIKPYAACRHCHAPIECALLLMKEYDINPIEIEHIEVNTYRLAVFGHDHNIIDGVNSAKMSIPYSVAVALVKNRANIDAFKKENIDNNSIKNICEKVLVIEDEEFTAISPGIRGAKVSVTLKNSKSYQIRVDYAKGEPENPLEKNELIQKFIALATFGDKTKEEAMNIVDSIYSLHTDLSEIYNL